MKKKENLTVLLSTPLPFQKSMGLTRKKRRQKLDSELEKRDKLIGEILSIDASMLAKATGNLKKEKLLDALLSEEIALINKYGFQLQKIQTPRVRETLSTLLEESAMHASLVTKIISKK